MTNYFFDKRGKLSVVKTGLFFMGLGLLFVFGSAAYVAIETESARSPLHIPIPEGAEEWAVETYGDRSFQKSFFKILTTDVESVVAHYQQQADQFGSERCKRLPPNGDSPDYDPENGTVPYVWKCLFERANVPGVSQTTQVIIQPGIKNEDPFLDSEGYTVIQYEQYWQK